MQFSKQTKNENVCFLYGLPNITKHNIEPLRINRNQRFDKYEVPKTIKFKVC